MNIRIDDDVPLPQPDKPDSWQTGPVTVIRTKFKEPVTVTADGWTSEPVIESVTAHCGICGAVIEADRLTGTSCDCAPKVDDGWINAAYYEANKLKDSMGLPWCYIPSNAKVDQIVELHRTGYNVNKQYPLPTTYDSKGVPTVDCFLVGGPLNGKNGPIVGTAKVVELDIYAADGTVSSVELYELGDKGELGVRHWKGTK